MRKFFINAAVVIAIMAIALPVALFAGGRRKGGHGPGQVRHRVQEHGQPVRRQADGRLQGRHRGAGIPGDPARP